MTDDLHPHAAHAGWEGRFSAIESNHLQLQRDISALTKDVATAIQATDNLVQSVRVVADNQTINTRTNWGVVLTGLVVFVMIMGLVVYEPMGMLTTDVSGHLKDGHPTSVIDKVDASTLRIESRLDRKSMLLNELMSKVDSLAITQTGTLERLLGIERELYPGATYRSGRPTGGRPVIKTLPGMLKSK